MDDLQKRVSELNAMAKRAPRPEQFSKVREALGDKLEGVQSAALKVLGAWGDADSRKLIRGFLIKSFDRPQALSVRGVAIRALISTVTRGDVDWVLDLYFDLPGVVTKHEIFHLVLALPPDAARRRLVVGLSHADPANRQAAVKAMANMSYQDRFQLIAPLRNDQDRFVRETVQSLLRSRL